MAASARADSHDIGRVAHTDPGEQVVPRGARPGPHIEQMPGQRRLHLLRPTCFCSTTTRPATTPTCGAPLRPAPRVRLGRRPRAAEARHIDLPAMRAGLAPGLHALDGLAFTCAPAFASVPATWDGTPVSVTVSRSPVCPASPESITTNPAFTPLTWQVAPAASVKRNEGEPATVIVSSKSKTILSVVSMRIALPATFTKSRSSILGAVASTLPSWTLRTAGNPVPP